jgi:predicted Rossmann fold nucleotide-binding protein DprA/Smf involved in DNA uptake
MTMRTLRSADAAYPTQLHKRLGMQAPPRLTALGDLDLLNLPKTALFCSAKRPGDAILAAYDKAAVWRDSGQCVISGFHSPIEKECLQILFRGTQPVIICPARSLENMRVSAAWKAAMESERMLILSFFSPTHRRVTADLAARRNEMVSALADEARFAHIAPGGKSERLARRLTEWQIPFSAPDSSVRL